MTNLLKVNYVYCVDLSLQVKQRRKKKKIPHPTKAILGALYPMPALLGVALWRPFSAAVFPVQPLPIITTLSEPFPCGLVKGADSSVEQCKHERVFTLFLT